MNKSEEEREGGRQRQPQEHKVFIVLCIAAQDANLENHGLNHAKMYNSFLRRNTATQVKGKESDREV